MSSPLYYFKFHVKDWLADARVRAMTPAQRGAYVDLLCFQWEEGALPNDTHALARMCGIMHRHFVASYWPVLCDRFPPVEGQSELLKSARMEQERAKANGTSQHLASSGVKGAQSLARNRANAKQGKRQKPNGSAGKSPANGRDSRETIEERREEPSADGAGGVLDLPLSCSRQQALDAIAAASAGRFKPSLPTRGGMFKLDRLRHRPDALAVCGAIGKWLADGGDAWRGKLDGRAIGDSLDAWVAHAAATIAAEPPPASKPAIVDRGPIPADGIRAGCENWAEYDDWKKITTPYVMPVFNPGRDA